MCVALPGRIIAIADRSATSIPATIDVGGRHIEVDLIMVPTAQVGDFVIAHSGYAIRVVAAASAEQTRRELGISS